MAARVSSILLIINRGSGKTDCAALAHDLQRFAQQAGVHCEVRLVRGERQIRMATEEAKRCPHERIVAGGGDGTLNAVASALAGLNKEMAILPLGTFNYFAREFNVPSDVHEAFKLGLEGEARPVSLGEINGVPFLNNASIGLYPKVLEVREHTYARWGRSRLAAYWSVLTAVIRHHANLRLEIAGAEGVAPQRLKTPMVFAGRNGYQLAEFGLPGPECVLNGSMAVYILPKATRLGLVRLALRMFFGQLEPREDFKVLCATELELALKRGWWTVAVDGERVRVRSPITLRMRRDALRVVLPPWNGPTWLEQKS